MSSNNYGPGGRSNRNSSWSKTSHTRRHYLPAGLRGKQIGMYFKERQTTHRAFRKAVKKERLITLRIPPAVTTQVTKNLLNIARIAKALNIPVANVQMFNLHENESVKKSDSSLSLTLEKDGIEVIDDSIPDDIQKDDRDNVWEVNRKHLDSSMDDPDDCFKKPDFIQSRSVQKIHDYSTSQPGSSSAPDFIPIGNDEPKEYGSGERILSLRGGGDYKYGYEDIITGTFDEKLEACLTKGVSISMTTMDIEGISYNLHEEFNNMVTKSGYKEMLKFRDKLPTCRKSREILNVIENNQVVVISGETGCGKSTQVPQIILDSAICKNKGANIKILVTQPRRIAASSLATRVAQERAERLGNSVGYAVRLEKLVHNNKRINESILIPLSSMENGNACLSE